MQMTLINASDMQYGDQVAIYIQDNMVRPYATATVYYIEEDYVHLYRPYVHTSTMVSTSGIIPYIGVEDYKIYRKSSTQYVLLRRCRPGEIN